MVGIFNCILKLISDHLGVREAVSTFLAEFSNASKEISKPSPRSMNRIKYDINFIQRSFELFFQYRIFQSKFRNSCTSFQNIILSTIYYHELLTSNGKLTPHVKMIAMQILNKVYDFTRSGIFGFCE